MIYVAECVWNVAECVRSIPDHLIAVGVEKSVIFYVNVPAEEEGRVLIVPCEEMACLPA